MPISSSKIPVTLYIHIPWCVRKCPYCDFNSHELKQNLPEALFVAALKQEIEQRAYLVGERPIESIFFGGGTPSLLSGDAIAAILKHIQFKFKLADTHEITLEANPGTVDAARFQDYYAAGITRLSLGVQSFQDAKLKNLGRIHDGAAAERAITAARDAGFQNFNIDLMYGLPEQSIKDALYDLTAAVNAQPTHISWYQLTIEPNTHFQHFPPPLPHEDIIWDIQNAGMALLAQHGFVAYEVSAYAREQQFAKHNLNYWQYGDYLGLGPGAHSKITHDNQVIRFSQVKHPNDYLDANKRAQWSPKSLANEDLIFEFMLNALRLHQGFAPQLFTARTGLTLDMIAIKLQEAVAKNFLRVTNDLIQPTDLGRRYLNNLMLMFLPG